ncbi:hypothetical protein BP00DRAFT_352526, partial [Aspergillus indologenus CBS 114.80]
LIHTTTGCGKQGFPSAQPYLSHTPGANPFCCMYLLLSFFVNLNVSPAFGIWKSVVGEKGKRCRIEVQGASEKIYVNAMPYRV